MNRKTASGMMVPLLLAGTLMLAFSIQQVKCLEPPATEWVKKYGGDPPDFAYSMVQTSDEGYAIAGRTRSFGVGNDDFWLVKTDASGNALWNKTYGGTGTDSAWSVVETGDGGYAIGGSGFANLVKTDENGNQQWNKTYGGYIRTVVQTVDEGYALAGGMDSDFWLVKTDSAGNMEWNRTYGGADSETAYSMVQTSDGGYAIAGITWSFGAGEWDFWLVKTDADGNMVWNQTYGGAYSDIAYSVVETGDGGYAIAGDTFSFGIFKDYFWLVKTDSEGTMHWNKTYGAGSEKAYSVAQTDDDGYALAGYTYSFGAGRADFWLVKTDASGSVEWNQTYGGIHWDEARSVVQTCDGGYALAGYGDSLPYGAGGEDFWLVKTEGAPKDTEVFFNVYPNPASVGETVTLRGILVDEFSLPLGNESVQLYGRRLSGSWRFITALATNSYGLFVWQAEIPIEGVFVFAAYYPGSDDYESSYSFAVLMVQ